MSVGALVVVFAVAVVLVIEVAVVLVSVIVVVAVVVVAVIAAVVVALVVVVVVVAVVVIVGIPGACGPFRRNAPPRNATLAIYWVFGVLRAVVGVLLKVPIRALLGAQ